jgi:hypothetical protein
MSGKDDENKPPYIDAEFWKFEPVQAKASKDVLDEYLNRVSQRYVEERSENVFKTHLQYMLVVGWISLLWLHL